MKKEPIDRQLAGLARLMEESPVVEAVRVPAHGRSILVATLGVVDEKELGEHLREVLEWAAETFPRTPGPPTRAPDYR